MTTAGVGALHDLPKLVVGDLQLVIASPTDRKTIEIVVERDASLILKAPPARNNRTSHPVRNHQTPVGVPQTRRERRPDRPTSRQTVRRRRRVRLPRPQLPPHPHPTHPRRPPQPRPLLPPRLRSRPRRRRDAPLVHQNRNPMAPTKNPPLGIPPRRADRHRQSPRPRLPMGISPPPPKAPNTSTSTGPPSNSPQPSSTTSSSTNSPTYTKPTTPPTSGPSSNASYPATKRRRPPSPPSARTSGSAPSRIVRVARRLLEYLDCGLRGPTQRPGLGIPAGMVGASRRMRTMGRCSGVGSRGVRVLVEGTTGAVVIATRRL